MSRVLVTAVGSLSAGAVLASLRALPEVERIAGCDIHLSAWLANAVQLDVFEQVPLSTHTEAYLSALTTFCQRENITHVMPLTDPEVDLLSKRRHALDPAILCTASEKVVQRARDKLTWEQELRRQTDISCLPTLALHGNLPGEWRFPLLAKPRLGRSRQGHQVLKSHDDLGWLRQHHSVNDLILQPLREGNVLVADLIRDARTGKCASIVREELLRTSNGAGTTVKLRPEAVLHKLAQDIARHLELEGPMNLEFLESNGKYELMDINPRFSAGVGFSTLAGYDMIANTLRYFSNQSIAPAATDYDDAILSRIEHMARLCPERLQ